MSDDYDDEIDKIDSDSAKLKQIHDWFEKYNDDYIEFERIPEKDRRHPRPDICAMIYLHERFGGDGDAVTCAEHDEIWLGWDVGEIDLTEEDVLYITRCGVRYDSSTDSLAMFV